MDLGKPHTYLREEHLYQGHDVHEHNHALGGLILLPHRLLTPLQRQNLIRHVRHAKREHGEDVGHGKYGAVNQRHRDCFHDVRVLGG